MSEKGFEMDSESHSPSISSSIPLIDAKYKNLEEKMMSGDKFSAVPSIPENHLRYQSRPEDMSLSERLNRKGESSHPSNNILRSLDITHSQQMGTSNSKGKVVNSLNRIQYDLSEQRRSSDDSELVFSEEKFIIVNM